LKSRDGKVLPFVRPTVVGTKRTPVSSWVSDSGSTSCTFLKTMDKTTAIKATR